MRILKIEKFWELRTVITESGCMCVSVILRDWKLNSVSAKHEDSSVSEKRIDKGNLAVITETAFH